MSLQSPPHHHNQTHYGRQQSNASSIAPTFHPPSLTRMQQPQGIAVNAPSSLQPSISIPWNVDETALSLFQHCRPATHLSIHLTASRVELIQFHEQYEVIASNSEVSEFVLSASIELSQQLHSDSNHVTHVLHISTSDTWHTSMEQSGIDLTGTTLLDWHHGGRVKTATVTHLQQLLHISEYLQVKYNPLDRLIILIEGSVPLFLAEKPVALGSEESKVSPLIEQTLSSFARLVQIFPVICFWINSHSLDVSVSQNSTESQGASTVWREAHPKDALAAYWRKKIPKLLVFAPQQL